MHESVNVLGGAIRADFVPQYIMKACGAGRLNFSPTFCIYSWLYLAFKIREAVKHMSSSFSFKDIATKVKKMVDMTSCSLTFKLTFLSQSFCMLASTQTP